jgi:hypothetical protein
MANRSRAIVSHCSERKYECGADRQRSGQCRENVPQTGTALRREFEEVSYRLIAASSGARTSSVRCAVVSGPMCEPEIRPTVLGHEHQKHGRRLFGATFTGKARIVTSGCACNYGVEVPVLSGRQIAQHAIGPRNVSAKRACLLPSTTWTKTSFVKGSRATTTCKTIAPVSAIACSPYVLVGRCYRRTCWRCYFHAAAARVVSKLDCSRDGLETAVTVAGYRVLSHH